MAPHRATPPLTPEQREMFWARVDRIGEGCWLWGGSVNSQTGYGQLKIAGRKYAAHRLSYVLSFGPIPAHDSYHGLCVCHKCDVRRCVRPDHLFLGLSRDNARDAAAKGRTASGSRSGPYTHPESVAHGERSPHSKLSLEDVVAIKEKHCTGLYRYKDLAAQFGVSVGAINHILNGRCWTRSLS